MEPRYYVLHINPEPWAIGSVSRSAKGATISPNPNLVAYQNAVREAMEGVSKLPPSAGYKLTFRFWRQQAKYIDMNDHVRQRNQADATNMQKALEDALQGILFDNDRQVADIRSVIIDQGPKVTPCIIIEAELAGNMADELESIPVSVLEQMIRGEVVQHPQGGKWESAEELF